VQIDDVRPFSEDVLELATLIERDLIDSAHLDAYMEYLLNVHLIELSASCRIAAKDIASQPVPFSPSEIGCWLRLWVAALEVGYGIERSDRHDILSAEPQTNQFEIGRYADVDQGSAWLSELLGTIFWFLLTAILLAEWKLAVITGLHYLVVFTVVCFSSIGLLSASEILRHVRNRRRVAHGTESRSRIFWE